MKIDYVWVFLGVLIGSLFTLVLLVLIDQDPKAFVRAMEPAVKAAGISGRGASDLKRALNPCVVSGPLPKECEKYVKDGVVTQPPIRIIVDVSK